MGDTYVYSDKDRDKDFPPLTPPMSAEDRAKDAEDFNGDCPVCSARWYGWLAFCWHCGWWRGDPV